MLTVSNYHYIREKYNTKYPSIFGVIPDEFKKQILLLRNQGDFIQPNEMIRNLNAVLESKDNYFLITFDDGLKEQFDYALPILDELNIAAIFFINSINHMEKKVSLVHKIHLVRSIISSEVLFENLIKGTDRSLNQEEVHQAHQFYRFDNHQSAELKYFLNVLLDFDTQEKFINGIFTKNFDEKEVLENLYMDRDEIQQLIKRGFIGSHTHTHLPLGIHDKDTIIHELETTKKYLENLGGSAINFVAYPYGTKEAATKEVGELAKYVGYRIGFTTNPGVNNESNNPLLLNRFDCNDVVGGKNYKK
jgi:peptidoglycan/xylan/chitin deacetylase (PgdA/CDA1 family)